ncbi:hypothetical protein [Methylocaldum sp.]|uniref:hypothetical protein n=1 Tax=Methylocaldum sp. TaxID=1969727 RepID=UPI002D28E6B8|nr:hypothetical protein [Methylocaldum sp.]HYE38184.1 hypothetical protein [Methylocaldum sp.]
MSVKKIQKQLRQALIYEAEMSQELYEEELAEYLDEFKQSLLADHDEYLFSVIEDSGRVAMVLIEQSGEVHINREAKRRLKEIWGQAYLVGFEESDFVSEGRRLSPDRTFIKAARQTTGATGGSDIPMSSLSADISQA